MIFFFICLYLFHIASKRRGVSLNFSIKFLILAAACVSQSRCPAHPQWLCELYNFTLFTGNVFCHAEGYFSWQVQFALICFCFRMFFVIFGAHSVTFIQIYIFIFSVSQIQSTRYWVNITTHTTGWVCLFFFMPTNQNLDVIAIHGVLLSACARIYGFYIVVSQASPTPVTANLTSGCCLA